MIHALRLSARATTVLLVGVSLMFALPAAAQTEGVCLTETLKRGSRSAQVTQLQEFLVQGGFLAEESATGYFGALTEKAVQAWQKEIGLVSSGTPESTGFGTVGAKTRALLCTPSPESSVTVDITEAEVSIAGEIPEEPAVEVLDEVVVEPDVLEIVSFTVSPESVASSGDPATLTWETKAASSCVLTTDTGALVASGLGASGSYGIEPANPLTYTLTCLEAANGTTVPKQTVSADVYVSVDLIKPACTITLDKSSYVFGDTIRLSWTSENALHGMWKQELSDARTMPFGQIHTSGRYFIGANAFTPQTVTLVMIGEEWGEETRGECTATISISAPTVASRSLFAQIASIAALLFAPRGVIVPIH